MKHRFSHVILVVLFLFSFAFRVNATVLVVAHDTNLTPFEFKDNDGKFVGFDIELWKHIAELAKIPYIFQPMDFNGIIPGLQTGSIDVAISGMSITAEREKVVLFSEPYYQSGMMILVREEESVISKLEDLSGKIVGVKTGTSSVEFMREFAQQKELKLFPGNEGIFLELMSGGVDAVVFDAPVLQHFASVIGKGKVKIVGPVYAAHPYGIAFRQGLEDIVKKVNLALDELKRDGTYMQLYKKWFKVSPAEVFDRPECCQ